MPSMKETGTTTTSTTGIAGVEMVHDGGHAVGFESDLDAGLLAVGVGQVRQAGIEGDARRQDIDIGQGGRSGEQKRRDRGGKSMAEHGFSFEAEWRAKANMGSRGACQRAVCRYYGSNMSSIRAI